MRSASSPGGGSSLEGLSAELRRLADEIEDAFGAGVAALGRTSWQGGVADRLRTGADERRVTGRRQADHLRAIASRIDASGRALLEDPEGRSAGGPGEDPSPGGEAEPGEAGT